MSNKELEREIQKKLGVPNKGPNKNLEGLWFTHTPQIATGTRHPAPPCDAHAYCLVCKFLRREALAKLCAPPPWSYGSSDSVTRTRLESRCKKLWLDSSHVFHRIKRNEHFFLQWWSRLAQIFCFDCLVMLCYISEMSGLWNFSVQSWSNKIKSDPVLIRKIFENHQSDPVLIRQCKIMYFYFASWGKRTTGAILSLAKYDWLKAK